MATFKAVVLKGKKQGNAKGEHNIKIGVTQKGKTKYIKTDYYIPFNQMGKNGKIKKSHPNADFLNSEFETTISSYNRTMLQLGEKGRMMSAEQIRDLLVGDKIEDLDFFQYSDRYIANLKHEGKKTWKSYHDSIEQIKHFVNRPVPYLQFGEITVEFLKKFERYQLDKGNSLNTVSVYLRAMRTVFLAAEKEFNKRGLQKVIIYNPFDDYSIKSEPTKKRNIERDLIIAIRDLETTDEYEQFARDMFMLIFYLIGINIIDLFWCKGLNNGRLEYKREKTATKNGREYSIKVEPEAMKIIEKYKGSKYLLKFSDFNEKERGEVEKIPYIIKGETRYRYNRRKWGYANEDAFGVSINDNLVKIIKKLKEKGIQCLPDKITTYWARHSWSTIAWNDCDIPEGIVSVCLGHDETPNQTTQIYIEKRLRIIDEANIKVLNSLI